MPDELVVIVDDDKDLLGSLKKLMVYHGLRVITAGGGREALDKLEALTGEQNTVMVLDIKMSGMDGFRTLQNVKRRFPKSKVIVHSAYCSCDEIIEGIRIDGAVACLAKPSEPLQLLETVQQAFDSF